MVEMPSPVDDSMVEAENSMCEVCDVLVVLRMAIGFETGGLDPEERNGIETVIGHVAILAEAARDKVVACHSLVRSSHR